MQNKIALELEQLPQTQGEPFAYIEFKALFCPDLTRADIECQFGVKPAYRRLAPDNLVYEASSRGE